MQVHAHSWLELVDAEPLRLRAPLVNGLYDVVGARLDPLPVAESDAKDGLLPVVLDRDDAGDAVSVIHLAPDLIAVDELADRHHSVWRRDECVVRLACRALRLLLEPDVEPDGRVEGRELVHEEELLRDDVRGRLRPELRKFDAFLLEDGLVLARDEGVARLPFDLVERVAAGDREVAADAELGAVVDDEIRRRFGGVLGSRSVVGGRHLCFLQASFQGLRRGPEASHGTGQNAPRETASNLVAAL